MVKKREILDLEDAIYNVVHHSEKDSKEIARLMGKSLSLLTRWGLEKPKKELEDDDFNDDSNIYARLKPKGSGCNFLADYIVPLTILSGNYAILDFLERSVGRVAIPIPRGDYSLNDICKLSLKSVEEFGHLMSEVSESLEDDTIDPHELARILKECEHAQRAITCLVEALKKKAAENSAEGAK